MKSRERLKLTIHQLMTIKIKGSSKIIAAIIDTRRISVKFNLRTKDLSLKLKNHHLVVILKTHLKIEKQSVTTL